MPLWDGATLAKMYFADELLDGTLVSGFKRLWLQRLTITCVPPLEDGTD